MLRLNFSQSLLMLVRLLLPAVLPLSAHALDHRVQIPAQHLPGGKTLSARYFWPEITAASRYPAVILLHGCGGLGPQGRLSARHQMWKDWLVERGFVVVMPESFTSRGVDQICTQSHGSRSIRQYDRVQDVLATKAWLENRSDIDANRIVLWGWSHGAGTVLATVSESSGVKASAESKFAQAIAFYPGCSTWLISARPKTLETPLQILSGGADDWTPVQPCLALVHELQAAGLPANIVVYPGAYHDFDNPGGKLRVRKDVPNGVNGPAAGVTVGPDPAAREAAKALIDQLLAKLRVN